MKSKRVKKTKKIITIKENKLYSYNRGWEYTFCELFICIIFIAFMIIICEAIFTDCSYTFIPYFKCD